MSIRRKLTIFMLFIGLVPTLVVSAVAYIAISNELTFKTVEQLVSTATKQEQKINALLQNKQEDAIKLTNRFDLQSALGRYLASNGQDGARDVYDILFNKKVASPDIKALYVVGLDGNIIATTIAGDEGKALPAADFAIPDGQETTTIIKEDERDGINKLYITTRLTVNKKPAAYVGVIFRIDDMVAAIQDYTGLGATGETVVGWRKKDGNVVSLFPLRFDTDAALKTSLNSLNLFATANTVNQEAQDYRNQPVTVASRSLVFTDWVIATKIDQNEAFATSTQLRTALILIALVTSVLIMLAAFYLSRFFTEPILRIARISKLIGKGEFSARLDIRRNDEIGALAGSINAMGVSLKDFVSSIESQRTRLEIILNSTAESIVAIDKDGRIIIANKSTSELVGLPVNKIVGKHIYEVFLWAKDEKPFAIDYSRPSTRTYNGLQFIDPASQTRYVKLVVAHVSGEQAQQAAQTIITIHDETKGRELENMKIDFVSMAAHELRTPLAAIRGYLELMRFKGGKRMTEEVEKYLRLALKGTSELGGLINNLLDVTRIERGTLAINLEKLDLAGSIRQAVNDALFSAQDKDIILAYDGPAKDCLVLADEIALREVINNLLSNAVKYTDQHGRIDVLVGEKGDDYTVTVKDTGVGIPKQALPNLFTKFYRVHGGLNSGSTGTGLGLFIAKSIVERHGGTIMAESEEGVGSVFMFSIPKFDETKLASLQDSQPISTRRNRGWTTKNIAR